MCEQIDNKIKWAHWTSKIFLKKYLTQTTDLLYSWRQLRLSQSQLASFWYFYSGEERVPQYIKYSYITSFCLYCCNLSEVNLDWLDWWYLVMSVLKEVELLVIGTRNINSQHLQWKLATNKSPFTNWNDAQIIPYSPPIFMPTMFTPVSSPDIHA